MPLNSQYKQERLIWLFTGAWFVINLVQAIWTELAHDEAYYWMYARHLDIGYYDHPPMIALMIRAGGWLFPGELGVRFFVILFSALSIPLLWLLCGKKDFFLFVAIVLATTVFQVNGFIGVPDSPLLFFTIVFFVAYRNYTSEDSVLNAVAVGAVVALLLYSKYHGLLVVVFTLFSNLKLFRRKTFYVAIAVAIAAYLPHIVWQVKHDYPSYQYHVLNKSQSTYDVMDSVEFLLATIAIAGPLTGIFLVAGLIRYKSGDETTRALKFTFWGFVIFFFLSTFNSRIEANWMATAVVPLMILGHRYISDEAVLRKWTVRMASVGILLFAFMRINLIADVVPAVGSKMLPEFYGWKTWTQEISAHADGCPVVIMNSYQRASKYSFYADTEALSLNNISYRPNQYDIWNIVDGIQGKRIALFRPWAEGRDSLETFDTPVGKYQLIFLDHFHSYTQVRITTVKDWFTFPANTEVEIPITFHHDETEPLQFGYPGYPSRLLCVRNYYTDFDQEIELINLDSIRIADNWSTVVRMRTPEKPGPYYIRFCIQSSWLPAYLNSRLIRMDVE